MPLSLKPHPDFRGEAVSRIDVDVVRAGRGRLSLRYLAFGDIEGLSLPPLAAPARADDLWRHTCFEVFLRAPPGEPYVEFNFSPSRQWAAYRFDSYRGGMQAPPEVVPPQVEISHDAQCYEISVALSLQGFRDLPDDARWALGLSAVIEEKNGRKSYWALAHPSGKPDFHHANGFAFVLPGALA